MARGAGRSKHKPRTEVAPEADLEDILGKIREARNFDFRNYKRGTLARRIQRRTQERRKRNLREYSALLDREPAEFDALLSSLLIKVTSFFRDPEAWEELSTKAIPRMLAEKPAGEEIRVWSAGCATGEETFSAAIALAEAMGPAFAHQDVKIFGTDVDQRAIAYARKGQYTRAQVESVPKKVLADWFVEEGDGYAVRKELRRAVVFGINNLVSDAPISRLDLLICRNVFIYLDAPLQNRVLSRFHYALRPHGILMLGKSELIPFAGRLYDAIDLSRRIYRKDGRREASSPQERLSGLPEADSAASQMEEGRAQADHADDFHGEVLQSLPLPVIATAADGTVTLWNAASAQLWNRPESEVLEEKLPTLGLPGLSGDLLIEKTSLVREGRSTSEWGEGTVGPPGDPHAAKVSVQVSALRDAHGERSGLIYLVHDVTAIRQTEMELRRATEERQSANEELQTINEEMQSSNEELETTNEELQSANEELQSTNEELQSTNEELETTNEELQSTNAELDATNRELAHRTEEMNKLAYYQRTIIRSLSSAVIVLDGSGRITMWNLAAERLLGMTESEALGQVVWTLDVPGLDRGVVARIRKGLAKNLATHPEEVAYELPNGGTGRAMLAGVPVLDGGSLLGAVLIFEDVTKSSSLLAEDAKLKDNNDRPAKAER
jgi:two-component system, chemotaxis family, CheB/CheR fusion protein